LINSQLNFFLSREDHPCLTYGLRGKVVANIEVRGLIFIYYFYFQKY